MTFYTDLIGELNSIVGEKWTSRKGLIVPDEASVTFGHDAVVIDAAVMYADLAGSTGLVQSHPIQFSATMYKAFLTACLRIIRYFDGEITAYDGDRVMSVFMGERKCTRAVRSALAINAVMTNIVNPAIKAKLAAPDGFYLAHGCGVDVSELFVVKTGIRNYDDLAWIGNAANVAAKLSNLREDWFHTYITDGVFEIIANDAKFHDKQLMWESRLWNGRPVHRSTWWVGPLAQ